MFSSKTSYVKHNVCAMLFSAVANACGAYTYLSDLYNMGYNHVSTSVLGQNMYAKAVCYSFSGGECHRSVMFDQGWLWWLVPLYSIKRGLRWDVTHLLTPTDFSGLEGTDGLCVFEFVRGKGAAAEVVLARTMNELRDPRELPHVVVASATSDDISNGRSLSLTMFMQQRLSSFNSSNGFKANEVLSIAALSVGSPERDVRNSKLNVLVEKKHPSPDTCVHNMYEELQFEGDNLVILTGG
jgi:hypothetical protein